MSFQERAEEALRIAGDFDIEDFYPAPFPEDVPTVQLERISLNKLLNSDAAEVERVMNICTTTGFFYLDMLDHTIGRQIWRSACYLFQLGRKRFASTPEEEKLRYKPLKGVRVFDRGYMVRTADQYGQPNGRELFNVPQSELFGTKMEGSGLPGWLAQDQGTFEEALKCGNVIACAILSIFEKKLQLPVGSFTNLHRLHDDSGDFLRILRYPGTDNPIDGADGFPAHQDAMSVAILFTWLGGLQIPDAKAEIQGLRVKKEDWRWIKPEPGCAIVNLGLAMEIFTNKVLKSGIHRVIKAPGLQRPHDRLSVLIATRPKNTVIMRPFESPVIPQSLGESKENFMNSLEWGYSIIVEISQKIMAEAAARGSASVLANG